MRDHTSDLAIGNVAAEHLLSRMEQLEESQRALVFAYVGIELPLSTLARELGITHAEVRSRIAEGLKALQADQDLQFLAGIRKAGDLADFHEHIRRLRLESWFCAQCHQFQLQKGIGRPRTTCSDHCRRERHKANRRASGSGRA